MCCLTVLPKLCHIYLKVSLPQLRGVSGPLRDESIRLKPKCDVPRRRCAYAGITSTMHCSKPGAKSKLAQLVSTSPSAEKPLDIALPWHGCNPPQIHRKLSREVGDHREPREPVCRRCRKDHRGSTRWPTLVEAFGGHKQ
jgi:hypothetical protein